MVFRLLSGFVTALWILVFVSIFSSYRIRLEPRTVHAMTKTQMQATAAAITGANFPATLITTDGGVTWKIRSAAPDFVVNVNTIKSLADAQGISAFCAEAEYR